MKRESFLALVREALDSLPERFASLMENIAVVVEDTPPNSADEERLMGVFEGTPRTEHSFFSIESGPSRIVLFQKTIEEYAQETAQEQGRPVADLIKDEVRLTVLHEIGHYFGLDEDALEDV